MRSSLVMQFAIGLALASGALADGPTPPSACAPPPIVFEGFGFDGFDGGGSITAMLRGIDGAAPEAEMPLGVPVDVVVKGPSGRDRGADPLAAEFKGRLEGVDLLAGMQADSTMVEEGPKKWVGGLRLANAREDGRDVLELRTSLGRQQQAGIVGVEVGPRIERRLRGGLTVFLDGKAQAQARRSVDTGVWMLPGMDDEKAGTVGVAASTGLSR